MWNSYLRKRIKILLPIQKMALGTMLDAGFWIAGCWILDCWMLILDLPAKVDSGFACLVFANEASPLRKHFVCVEFSRVDSKL
jgi:hypothetical protein